MKQLTGVLEAAAQPEQTRAVYYSARIAETTDICSTLESEDPTVCGRFTRMDSLIAVAQDKLDEIATEYAERRSSGFQQDENLRLANGINIQEQIKNFVEGSPTFVVEERVWQYLERYQLSCSGNRTIRSRT
jgi:hypothetical protein